MAILTVDSKKYPQSKTSGIQETIDQIPEEGGTVFIPAGKYELKRSIVLKHKTTITGEGPATVITRTPPVLSRLKKDYDATSLCLSLEKPLPLSPGDFLVVKDFDYGGRNAQILCVKKNEGETLVCDKIYGKDLVYHVSEDAHARNSFPAIRIRFGYGIVLENFTIDGGDYNYAEAWKIFADDWNADFIDSAVSIRESTHITVKNLRILKWPSDGITIGSPPAGFPGAEKMPCEALFANNIVEDCMGNGLHAGANFENSIWVNNASLRNRDGFLFCIGANSTIVANNVFSYNRRNGIWGLGDPDHHNIVEGNICVGNGFCGIEAMSGVGNIINSNLLRNNSQKQPGTFSGLLLKETKDTVAVGNLCVDSQEQPTQIHGLEVDRPQENTVVKANLSHEFSNGWKVWDEFHRERDRRAALKASTSKS